LQLEIDNLEKEIANEERNIGIHHEFAFIGNIHEVDDKTLDLTTVPVLSPIQKPRRKKAPARSDLSLSSSRMSLRSSARLKRNQTEIPDEESETNKESQDVETSSIATIDWVAKTLEFSPLKSTTAGIKSTSRRQKKTKK
jgi:hypothetical protein